MGSGRNENHRNISSAEEIVKKFDVVKRGFVADNVNQQVDVATIKRADQVTKVPQNVSRFNLRHVRLEPGSII